MVRGGYGWFGVVVGWQRMVSGGYELLRVVTGSFAWLRVFMGRQCVVTGCYWVVTDYYRCFKW